MLNNYMAIIFLAESLDNIRSLTKMRPLASLPVGGTYRIIDFSLSNLVNAGIRNVGIQNEKSLFLLKKKRDYS